MICLPEMSHKGALAAAGNQSAERLDRRVIHVIGALRCNYGFPVQKSLCAMRF